MIIGSPDASIEEPYDSRSGAGRIAMISDAFPARAVVRRLARVRVELSKKQLMIVRPRSSARFLSACRFNST
jgi:hypothetical protein